MIEFIEDSGTKHELPHPGEATEIEAPGWCSGCGKPRVLRGKNPREFSHGVEAPAYCTKCDEPQGKLVWYADTLFGLEEDRRVLSGPWKVF